MPLGVLTDEIDVLAKLLALVGVIPDVTVLAVVIDRVETYDHSLDGVEDLVVGRLLQRAQVGLESL
ncbi:hypothetical protein [Streptomyces sp. NPDC020598]|uniref:hypothetical protein n=1 Tax=Streptomyces sp. NPDC020598 TaxID=3365081 RepID=UPI0037A38EDB